MKVITLIGCLLVLCATLKFSGNHQLGEATVLNHESQTLLHLSFQYAARENHPLATSSLTVSWNNQNFTFTPKDYNVQSISLDLVPIIGDNVLRFVGGGASDKHGASITNIVLKNGGENLIVNGDFHTPKVTTSWDSFQSIPGGD